MRILFIHPEGERWEELSQNFRYEGDTLLRADGTLSHGARDPEKPDAVLVGMDGSDGVRSDMLSALSLSGGAPILLLTERASAREVAFYLECGYDEVIRLPMEFAELKARIHSLRRRVQRRRPPVPNPFEWGIGEVRFDLVHRTASRELAQVEFTTKEFVILSLLMQEPGKVWDRVSLARELGGREPSLQDRTVDVYVRRLRNKLRRLGWDEVIQTIWGEGYSFVPEEEE